MSDALFPFVLIAVIIFVTVLCYLREGRNAALEQQLKRPERLVTPSSGTPSGDTPLIFSLDKTVS
jgi:hypothetical protein